MDVNIVVALIGFVALVSASLITGVLASKYTKRKIESSTAKDTQEIYKGVLTDYKGIINDLSLTNSRLIEERESEIEKRKKEVEKRKQMEQEIFTMKTQMTIILGKLDNIEPQRCLTKNCVNRVMP